MQGIERHASRATIAGGAQKNKFIQVDSVVIMLLTCYLIGAFEGEPPQGVRFRVPLEFPTRASSAGLRCAVNFSP
jgi:hypothetical protein